MSASTPLRIQPSLTYEDLILLSELAHEWERVGTLPQSVLTPDRLFWLMENRAANWPTKLRGAIAIKWHRLYGSEHFGD